MNRTERADDSARKNTSRSTRRKPARGAHCLETIRIRRAGDTTLSRRPVDARLRQFLRWLDIRGDSRRKSGTFLIWQNRQHETFQTWRKQQLQRWPVYAVSLGLHLAAAVLLWCLVLAPEPPEAESLAAEWMEPVDTNVHELEAIVVASPQAAHSSSIEELTAGPLTWQAIDQPADLAPGVHGQEPPAAPKVGFDGLVAPQWHAAVATMKTAGPVTRQPQRREMLLARNGGTAESERAVRMGLAWLKQQQHIHGHWGFDPLTRDGFRHPTRELSAVGTTALALLPWYASGQTHLEGPDQAVIRSGLEYLLKHQADDDIASPPEAALVALVLTEAYVLTRDDALRLPAQRALERLTDLKDPLGSGWNHARAAAAPASFECRIAALKLGRSASLHVPESALVSARSFVDDWRLNSDDQVYRGWNLEQAAVAADRLLSRMQLGTPREQPELVRDIERLAALGPSMSDALYNFRTTQVMFQAGGSQWDDWNNVMREQLIATQTLAGRDRGTWPGRGGTAWATFADTILNLLTLQTYYRNPPLYPRES